MALSLNMLDEAYDFSLKVEMVDDRNTLAKEFLYRYQILKTKADVNSLERFFYYASSNPEFVKLNEINPMIIDFYHDYYLFYYKL